MEYKNINKQLISKILTYAFLFLLMILIIFPLVYAFFGSFKTTLEFLNGAGSILPEKWNLDNYVTAWKEANFAKYTYNSFFISVMSVILTLIVGSMGGYVLSRATFPGKALIITSLGLVMFVPNVVLIYPIFRLCKVLALTNSLWGMIITQVAAELPFTVILITAYMHGISKEIDEAARIDGCSFFKIYLTIILPLSKPILATTALITFKNAWNNYLMPLALSLSKPQLRPLTVGVLSLKDMGEGISSWNLMIAGSVMSLIPMIVIYIFMNKYFVEGITAGSVKG